MKWINFLHIYQPPAQPRDVVKKITEESYFLILELLAKYPGLRLTINISGSLLELWEKYNEEDIVAGFKKYIDEGRLELVGSAMYHPILPLIPEAEVRRQIELNAAILKKYFGEIKLRGFYLPEMAYSPEVGKIIKELGFEWIMLDDAAHFASEENHFPRPERLYEIRGLGLGAVFRNREISTTFPPEYIGTRLGNERTEKLPPVVISAHDGEMYGHRHENDRGFFEVVLSSDKIETLTISEYREWLKKSASENSTDIVEKVSPLSGSWETTRAEKAAGVPFALWDNPKNSIHQALWRFTKQTIEIIESSKQDPHYAIARGLLDKGLASCAWWWASERTLGAFSPSAWNPTEIERGGKHLLEAIRSLTKLPLPERHKAEEDFSALTQMIWKQHWERYTKGDVQA